MWDEEDNSKWHAMVKQDAFVFTEMQYYLYLD